MEYELRTFRIRDGHLDDFIDAWRRGVAPLRREFGFEIDGAWADESTGEFVWVLGYGGDEGLRAADQSYYTSDDRADLVPDPRPFIESVATARVRKVL